MAVQTLERTPLHRLRRIFPTGDDLTAQTHPLPLRSELFLIAHDDRTGRCHLNESSLQFGLAAAVLLELWLTNRVTIGWRYDARQGTAVADPGRITVLDTAPSGDTLTDTALVMLWHSGGTLRVGDFVKRFAATGLYERVRADMITAGIIRRTTRRRRWFFRTEAYQPAHEAYPVRARGPVRRVIDQHGTSPEVSDRSTLALASLVAALGLTPYLYPGVTVTGRPHDRLRHVVQRYADPTVREVIAAIPRRRAAR
jgi:hypothetical protein